MMKILILFVIFMYNNIFSVMFIIQLIQFHLLNHSNYLLIIHQYKMNIKYTLNQFVIQLFSQLHLLILVLLINLETLENIKRDYDLYNKMLKDNNIV